MSTIGSLNAKLNLNSAQFTEGLKKAGKRTKEFRLRSRRVNAVQKDAQRIINMTRSKTELYAREIRQLNRHLAAGRINQATYNRALAMAGDKYGVVQKKVGAFSRIMGDSARSIIGYAAAFLGLRAALSTLRSSLASIDQVAKTSDKLGIATDKLIGLHHAAELTGISASTLDMGIQRMTRRIAEAGQGTGEAKAAIAELGLDAKKLAAMAPDKQFYAVADAMQKVGSQGDKVRLGFKLFDSEGVALINTLAGGSAALQKMQSEAEALGLTFNRVEAAQIEQANDAWTKLKGALKGVANTMAIDLAPGIQSVSDSLTRLSKQSAEMPQDWQREDSFGGFLSYLATNPISAATAAIGAGFADMFGLLDETPGIEKIKGLKKATDDTTVAAEEMARAAADNKNQIAQLAEKYQTLADNAGKSQYQIDMAKLATLGAADSVIELAKSQHALAEQKDKQSKIDQIVSVYHRMGESARLAAVEIDSLRLANLGADEATIRHIQTMSSLIDEFKKQEQQQKSMEARAKSIFESTRSPMEQFKAEFTEVKELFAQGFLNKDTYARAIEDIRKRMLDKDASGPASFAQIVRNRTAFGGGKKEKTPIIGDPEQTQILRDIHLALANGVVGRAA